MLLKEKPWNCHDLSFLYIIVILFLSILHLTLDGDFELLCAFLRNLCSFDDNGVLSLNKKHTCVCVALGVCDTVLVNKITHRVHDG